MNQNTQKKKLLVIPTDYIDRDKMKVRIIEMAIGLSAFYEVYILTWHTTFSRKLWKRARNCIKDIFRKQRIVKGKEFIKVELPMLHRPLVFAHIFNSYLLRRFIKKEGIDVVFSGSWHMFTVPEKRGFRYVLDFGDIPVVDGGRHFERFIRKQTSREIQKADAVTASSSGLSEYVKQRYGKATHFIPNGAYIEKFRFVKREAVEAIRRHYNIQDKWVIGYIGLIGSWVEVDLLVKAFWRVKKDIANAALMLVGPSPFLEMLRKRYAADDIIITGPTWGDIINNFEVGVLPHEKNLFQDLAFHIKLIEYTAARKIVVSTPLNEVKRLNFPNVIQADLNVDTWVAAFKKAKNMKWQSEWDRLVESYDWSIICSRLNNVIEAIRK